MANTETANKIPCATLTLTCISLCHSCISIDGEYKGISVDEVTLLEAVRKVKNFPYFVDRDSQTIEMSDKTKFTVLKVNDFTAERRAMSIVVKNQNTGKIYAFVKGAETAIYSMLGEGKNAASLAIEIEKFSNRGLRTLVFAYKEISDMNEELEAGLILLGATAVEDLLQEDVASNISEYQ